MSAIESALSYAERGWPVLPITPREKRPLTRNGVKDASCDAGVIHSWFDQWPDANLAVAMGRPSGVFVVDLDAVLWPEEFGPKPEGTLRTLTGKGEHVWFTQPDDVEPGNRVGVMPNVDVRSTGGYVLVPPSTHPNGTTYHFVAADAQLAVPSTALIDILTRPDHKGDALPSTADVLKGVPEGQRDDVLFRSACKWRELYRDREVVETLVLAAAANCTPAFPRDEALRKVDQAFSYGLRPERRSLTDDGNAQRFVDQHRDELRWVTDARAYYVWDGKLWQPGGEHLATARSRQTLRLIPREAEGVTDDKAAAAIYSWAKSSLSRGKIEAASALARSDERIAGTIEQFDRNPFLLNAPNGTIDLRTGVLRDHQRDDLISHVTRASFNPNATAPTWEAFLRRCTHDSPGLMEFLQRLAGYAATGSVAEEVAVIFYGPGGTGKSKFLGALQYVLGTYAVEADAELLVKGRNDRHSDALFHIVGSRLVVATEASAHAKLDERFFKQLTGGDTINARQLYAQSKDYQPTWTIVWSTNHLPNIERFDEAIRRRLLVTPFTAVIPPEERDRNLAQRFAVEAEGILRWIIEGAVKWHADLEVTRADSTVATTGLTLPAEVVEATHQYEIEVDPLTDFIDDCCLLDPGVRVARTVLYRAYRTWAVMQDERRPLTNQQFFGRIRDRQDVTERTDRHFQGICLGERP